MEAYENPSYTDKFQKEKIKVVNVPPLCRISKMVETRVNDDIEYKIRVQNLNWSSFCLTFSTNHQKWYESIFPALSSCQIFWQNVYSHCHCHDSLVDEVIIWTFHSSTPKGPCLRNQPLFDHHISSVLFVYNNNL